MGFKDDMDADDVIELAIYEKKWLRMLKEMTKRSSDRCEGTKRKKAKAQGERSKAKTVLLPFHL